MKEHKIFEPMINTTVRLYLGGTSEEFMRRAKKIDKQVEQVRYTAEDAGTGALTVKTPMGHIFVWMPEHMMKQKLPQMMRAATHEATHVALHLAHNTFGVYSEIAEPIAQEVIAYLQEFFFYEISSQMLLCQGNSQTRKAK
jgi:hypothetical protein